MSLPTYVTPHVTQIFQQYATGHSRAVMLGGGLAFAWPNGYWHHTPLVILNPFAYASYQAFVGQAEIVKWCKHTLREIT
jgi:hypothetical protein